MCEENSLSVVNTVDSSMYVLCGPNDVKFLRNVEMIKTYVVHFGARVNDMCVISASSTKTSLKEVHRERKSLNPRGDVHEGNDEK